MRYEVIIAGTVNATYNTRTEAEKRIKEIKNSFYAMVHPIDTIYIREKK